MKANTIGALLDKMEQLRDERRQLAERDKDLKDRYDELEVQVMEMLDAQNMPRGSGRRATGSIREEVVANISDWEAFTKFISRTKNYQLFQRRVSNPAFRELFERKGVVPGLEPRTVRKLHLTTIKE